MDITFDSVNLRTADLRPDLAAPRALPMRRLTWLVPRARVWLSTINGPRGGVDKRCHVVLHTFGSRRRRR